MVERKRSNRSVTLGLFLAALVASSFLASPFSRAWAEETSRAIVVQPAVIYTEPKLHGQKIGELKPGTVVNFLEKHCTERRVQYEATNGWVLDLVVVPISGPAANPLPIATLAQVLEGKIKESGPEAVDSRNELMILYAVLLDYFPNSPYAELAIQNLQALQSLPVAAVSSTPAG